MMTTFIAIAVLAASTLLVLSNLRLVAQDTVQVVRDMADRLLGSGRLRQTVAFGALWALIFALAAL